MLNKSESRAKAILSNVCALGIAILIFSPFLVSCDDSGHNPTPVQESDQARSIGYSLLRKLLRDEQYIKAIRLAKSVFTFRALADPTKTLIDDIAARSSEKLTELDRLATLEPAITFGESCPAMLDQAMLNALRVTTAKDLVLASKDDFEVNLVVSQIQALRMISHLLTELRDIDPNAERQAWLERLSTDYEALYRRAVARLSLAPE
jgi:hypothetical protein